MNPRLRFAVVIATRNRSSLLARRALASVTAQNRRPDIVVVVDDSDARHTGANKKALRSFSEKTGIASEHLLNWRQGDTKAQAPAGSHNRARNVGALHIAGKGFNPRNTYIAVLDDDDEWLPHHLVQAETVACRQGADFMPCAYIRREPKQQYARTLPDFNGRDFLTGNPGVEGSTLIIRMSVFMRAGMFDESLPASDDRDLSFRLSLLPDIAVVQPPEPSVVYHADERRLRLTSRRGAAQMAGLSRFANKYRGWMSEKEYDAFCRRAKKLFGWKEQTLPVSPPAPKPARIGAFREKIALVIGVIMDARQKNHALLSDILALSKDARLSSVDIVVVPSSGLCGRGWRAEMEKWRRAGLRMHCADPAAAKWRMPLPNDKLRGMRPISINRTIVHQAVAHLAAGYRNPACWILDGDSRLHGLTTNGKGVVAFRPDYVGEIMRLRASGCDAAIGAINGAAPLPRAFTVRTQMIDLMHMLGRLSSPGRRHSPVNIARMGNAMAEHSYYHDCILGGHLECPLGILPPGCGTRSSLIRNLPGLLERLLAGDWITRPLLHFDNNAYLHRGGNMLVFDPAMLTMIPNGFACGEELRGIRRHDEAWRIIAEKSLNKKIASGSFPVTQSRKTEAPQAPDIARIAGDIAGHAITASLVRVAGKFDSPDAFIRHLANPSCGFFDNVSALARRRAAMTRASFFRIEGAAASMRAMLDSAGSGKNADGAIAALRNMEHQFSEEAFAKISKQAARLLNKAALRKAFADFARACRSPAGAQDELKDWARNERKANAIHLAKKAAGKTPRFLGHGGEGAAFADGRHVFKILHRWHSRADIADGGFLPSLAGKWQARGVLYPIIRARNDGGDLLLKLPFEKTAPYKGGCGAGMVAMLAALKQHGIVLWDIKPKNLRRKGDEVRLIDYGQHINPFTARDFDLMARKAWLCVRLAHRSNLQTLLTASLTNKNMPELQGYEILKTAVEQYAARSRVADSVLREAVKGGVRHILDYGTGKGKDAIMLAARGFDIDACDPALTAKTASRLQKSGVRVITAPDAEGKYDAVILRHVICEIFSDEELRRCLRRIRRLLKPGGKAVISSCDMHKMARDTVCAHHTFPRAAGIGRKFKYRKLIRSTGNIRKHIHRPESVLLREFARAEFRVVARRAFADIDINRLEQCGGVLQWTLKPIPKAQ